jgi:hypothetical protein
MGEGFIVRKGGAVTEQALAPTITEVSVTTTSITFTITNNDASTAVIAWESGDTTPDANILELAASATSSNIVVTGLTAGTTYTISATASVTGKILSTVTSLGIKTFDPTSVTSLYAWYDASQITGLSNNDPVATWSDLSGNSRDLTQSTPGSRPTYKTNQRNSLPIVAFDNSDDFMITDFSGDQKNTYFVVYKYRLHSTLNFMLFDSNNNSGRQIYFSNNDVDGMRIYAGTDRTVRASRTTNYEYATLLFDTSSSFGRINGSQSGTLNPGTQSMNGISLGTTPNRDTFAPIDVAEFIMYNKVCTGTEITDIENYLKDKWGFS